MELFHRLSDRQARAARAGLLWLAANVRPAEATKDLFMNPRRFSFPAIRPPEYFKYNVTPKQTPEQLRSTEKFNNVTDTCQL